jgi:hypothetical protein
MRVTPFHASAVTLEPSWWASKLRIGAEGRVQSYADPSKMIAVITKLDSRNWLEK